MLELFAGTHVVSDAFRRAGWETYTVEWDRRFDGITLYEDVSKLSVDDIVKLCRGHPDVIWASPDCTSYSVMAISTHRHKVGDVLMPKTPYAEFCDRTNEHVVDLIRALAPTYCFIENPMGGFRTMPFIRAGEREGLFKRYTVTYCQYGETRQKPTDIWTNHPAPAFKPPCKRGAPCHMSAPRGSKNGTQGIKVAIERAKIPALLCDHIVEICSSAVRTKQTKLEFETEV